MTKHPKRRRDLNQWAKLMVDLATECVNDIETPGVISLASKRV